MALRPLLRPSRQCYCDGTQVTSPAILQQDDGAPRSAAKFGGETSRGDGGEPFAAPNTLCRGTACQAHTCERDFTAVLKSSAATRSKMNLSPCSTILSVRASAWQHSR